MSIIVRDAVESTAGAAPFAAPVLPHSLSGAPWSLGSAEPAVAATTVVCTLGMHRSGTSLVSRLLNLLGVYLGEAPSLSKTGWDNPKGYWEHPALALLNDEILECFGGRWDEPPAFPVQWTGDSRLTAVKERARQLLQEFDGQPVWGWKDPRTCLTVPFWQELIGPMRYVVCLRNPCAVLASLSSRNGMSQEKAEQLWLTHVESSLRHTSGQPRMFVFYEDVISNWQLELRRLASFIGRPACADDPRLQALAAEFLEDHLCHHRMSTLDLAGHQRISFATKGLYLALRGPGTRGTSADGAGELTHHDRSLHRSLDLLATGALEAWHATLTATAERQELAHDKQVWEASIAGLQGELDRLAVAHDRTTAAASASATLLTTERDGLVAAAAALAAARDALEVEANGLRDALRARAVSDDERAAREQRLAQATAGLQTDLQGVMLERDGWQNSSEAAHQLLQEILASRAWKLVASSRRLIVRLLPAGSWRREVFSTIVTRIVRRVERVPRAR